MISSPNPSKIEEQTESQEDTGEMFQKEMKFQSNNDESQDLEFRDSMNATHKSQDTQLQAQSFQNSLKNRSMQFQKNEPEEKFRSAASKRKQIIDPEE